MPYELNNNQGVLNKNKDKREQKHPDFKGQINVEGKTFDIAMWAKTSKAGNEYYSLSVSTPRERNDAPREHHDAPRTSSVDELGDAPDDATNDLPF